MRVELLYTPGCGKYRKAQGALETVIAEERLPLPVHLTESSQDVPPLVILDGEPLATHHCFDDHCLDDLRDQINRRWNALTNTAAV